MSRKKNQKGYASRTMRFCPVLYCTLLLTPGGLHSIALLSLALLRFLPCWTASINHMYSSIMLLYDIIVCMLLYIVSDPDRDYLGAAKISGTAVESKIKKTDLQLSSPEVEKQRRSNFSQARLCKPS